MGTWLVRVFTLCVMIGCLALALPCAALADPPVANDDVATVDEDSVDNVIDVLANDSDPDWDDLEIWDVISDPLHGSVSIAGEFPNQYLLYTPDPDFPNPHPSGTDGFAYLITDGDGNWAAALVIVTVNNVNDPPENIDDANPPPEILEDDEDGEDIDVLANDVDPDDDPDDPADNPLYIDSIADLPSYGTATITPHGLGEREQYVNYIPDPDYYNYSTEPGDMAWNGGQPDGFSYTLSDGEDVDEESTWVDVWVRNVPDAPVAVSDNDATDEDTPVDINVLKNDSDADHGAWFDDPWAADPLTIVITQQPKDIDLPVTDPDVGTATAETDPVTGRPFVRFTPNAHWHGVCEFKYKLVDSYALESNEATVRVYVPNINESPIAVDDTATTDEDTPVDIDVLANDSDPDPDMPVPGGGALWIVAVSNPLHGRVSINPDETLRYVPDPNYNGSDSFRYVVSDGDDMFAVATVTVTINPVNDAPVANGDFASTEEDTPVDIDVLANDTDVEDETLTVLELMQPCVGTAELLKNGQVRYTPNADFYGVDFFAYRCTDGTDPSNWALVFVNIRPVNDPPVARDDFAGTDEDLKVSGNVLANDYDVDGDVLTVSLVAGPADGTLTLDPAGSFIYVPDANFNGTDSFTYEVSDGNGGTATATVTIIINPVNDLPVAADDDATTDEDTSVDVDVLANDSDVDGDTLSVQSFTQPSHGTVTDLGDGVLRYTPNADYNGGDSFTYRVNDGNGGSAIGIVTITVLPVNDQPVARDDSAGTDEDLKVSGNVLANDYDVDGDVLTVSLVAGPADGTLTLDPAGSFIYVPDPNFNGTDSFTYEVSDGNGGTATATVTIVVNPVNDPPTAVDDSATTPFLTAVDINVLANDSDADGDVLSIESFTQATHGTVTQVGNALRYTPDANWTGRDMFLYRVSDGNGGSAMAVVTVTVTPPDPIIVDNPAATLSGKWHILAPSGTWGANAAFSKKGKSAARFTPNLPMAGFYDVHIWYVSDPKKSSKKVPVNVFQSSTPRTHAFTVNQRANGGQWVHLGRFPFVAGTAGFVEFVAKGLTCADAVRFSYVGPHP